MNVVPSDGPVTNMDTLRGDVRPQPRQVAVIGGHRAILLDGWLPVAIGDNGTFTPLALLSDETPKRCHGFRNGCECGCTPRRRKVSAPAQPWENAA